MPFAPVDFALTAEGQEVEMTFDAANSLFNNVYLSLMVPLGSFFQDTRFGSLLHTLQRAKNTTRTEALAISYARQALAWLIASGRASAIGIQAQITLDESIWRMKFLIQVTQPGGGPVTFTIYTRVA